MSKGVYSLIEERSYQKVQKELLTIHGFLLKPFFKRMNLYYMYLLNHSCT